MVSWSQSPVEVRSPCLHGNAYKFFWKLQEWSRTKLKFRKKWEVLGKKEQQIRNFQAILVLVVPLAPHRTAGNRPFVAPKVQPSQPDLRKTVGTLRGTITQPLPETDMKKPEQTPVAFAPRVYERVEERKRSTFAKQGDDGRLELERKRLDEGKHGGAGLPSEKEFLGNSRTATAAAETLQLQG